MTETYWKAVRMDGTDFHTGTVRWLPPVGEPLPEGGLIVRHPTTRKRTTGNAVHYLSTATVPTDCTGMGRPCRLARVKRTRAAVWQPDPDALPNKMASWQWRVVEELDATLTLGPQGREVAALIERLARLTDDEVAGSATAQDTARDAARSAAWYAALVAASGAVRDAARSAAWYAAWVAASGAVRDTARSAAWYAAWYAALALIARDLISTEHYDALTRPWRTTIGPIHPDDKEPS